ncbi:peptidoglycan DD-metalloendopeptidase family protein [Winogradskyella sp.]|jgi:murein DD-endopeptidase MepM/ murein hydrolase activator NlpD|uniref:peptidoglycan DD-metalloendopeptidase family protein n=1 Tax=Winogradskyella sp. TaxID=1883156 RepID=UPI0025D40FF1|nr:peptidoglycan DD-metalloendopeptidase family protein [Winogradskyella sp.]MCT4630146.1 peptidoglycan DD-metalloendopeptidase family protein [Winogradskyella sp.]
MRSKITLLVFFLVFNLNYAQNSPSEAFGGEFIRNTENSECLTKVQRKIILKELKESIDLLKHTNKLAFSNTKRRGGTHPLFAWPVQKSASTAYNEIWGISNYVDHNPNYPNQITDYLCGTKTYDTTSGYNHQGIDIFSWPFAWYAMDNDQAEIIAATAGQIIHKSDGNFDRSCNFNTTTPWNAVYIQHYDGSIAWYGHLKSGSLTSKNVGDMVTEGEYLGIMGSSGVSTGPHLHFEVHTNSTYTQLVDPYAGTCNTFNTESWWQSQKPYSNPTVNAALTHTADPIFNDCPNAETTNLSNQFNVNDEVFFAVYLKDQESDTFLNLRIIKPDNTDLYNWNFNLTDNYQLSWWRWNAFPDVEGEWKWEVTYLGETTTHTFNVGALSIKDKNLDNTSIFPNPFDDVVTINSTTKIKSANVVDVLGKTVISIKETSANGLTQLNMGTLSNGLYFVTLIGEQNQKKTIKLIKK